MNITAILEAAAAQTPDLPALPRDFRPLLLPDFREPWSNLTSQAMLSTFPSKTSGKTDRAAFLKAHRQG